MIDAYFPTVIQAIPAPNKTIFVYFSDGRITQYDVEPQISRGGIFEKLKNDDFFTSALTVKNGTVTWNTPGIIDSTASIDIDPFTLYEAKRVSDPLAECG